MIWLTVSSLMVPKMNARQQRHGKQLNGAENKRQAAASRRRSGQHPGSDTGEGIYGGRLGPYGPVPKSKTSKTTNLFSKIKIPIYLIHIHRQAGPTSQMCTHGGVYLVDMHLTYTDVHRAHKRVPYGRASHGRASHGRACIS
jgi:hypothetical protein